MRNLIYGKIKEFPNFRIKLKSKESQVLTGRACRTGCGDEWVGFIWEKDEDGNWFEDKSTTCCFGGKSINESIIDCEKKLRNVFLKLHKGAITIELISFVEWRKL